MFVLQKYVWFWFLNSHDNKSKNKKKKQLQNSGVVLCLNGLWVQLQNSCYEY